MDNVRKKLPSVGARIIEGLEEAIAWTHGENDRVRVTLVHVPEVDVRQVAYFAAQSGDESGAAGSLAGGNQRYASASLSGIHHDLRQARHRWPALDRSALARCGKCE